MGVLEQSQKKVSARNSFSVIGNIVKTKCNSIWFNARTEPIVSMRK